MHGARSVCSSLEGSLIRLLFRSLPAAVLLLGAVLACPARASWMVPPAPDRPKDFTILKRDGLYHLFYIRNNPNLPPESTQVDFGHATSADLYFWDTHPPVVPTRPGLFDRSHVWAPSIVLRDGVYWMFYTGVSDTPSVDVLAQRIGVATSVDLETWNPVDEPIFTGNAVSWAWWDSLGSTPFRDPFVMSDPTSPGRWLMYYSTAPASDPAAMIVGVAASDGDFTRWYDLQPLWITYRQYSFNDVVESPHLFEHDGLWWLLFTTNSGQPISYATTSSNPLAPPEQWIYRGRLANMLNLNTAAWFASEYLRDGLIEYLCYVNGDRVEISRMVWQPNQPRFSLQQPDLFHVGTLAWQQPSVHEDSTATIRITSKWWSGHTLDLEAFWVDSTGAWHSVPNSEVDLPLHIPLTGDVTDYSWLAQAPVDTSQGAPDSVQIVVRTLDQTAVSNPIWIVRGAPGRPRIDPGLDPPPEITPVVMPGPEETPVDPLPILKPLPRDVLGAPAALLVNLPEEREGRLDVFDLQGRRVRRLAERRLPAGATVIPWDGRDDGGRRVGRGLYFARLVTRQETRAVRIVLR